MTLYYLFMTIQILGLVIMFADLVYVVSQKPSPMQAHIIALLFSTIIMFVGYLVEIRASSIEAALLGAAISYIGKPFVMLAAFMMICSFYNIQVNKVLYFIACFVCSLFFILVYTTPQTHLYYDEINWNTDLMFSNLELSHGVLYNAYIILTAVFFLGCLFLIIRGYNRDRSKENGYCSFYLLMMVICGITGYVVYLSDASNGFDFTMFGIFAGVICLSILFYKYRIFDMLAVAKDEALENSSTGLVVFNGDNKVLYANKMAETLLETKIKKQALLALVADDNKILTDDEVYNVTKKDIVVRGSITGKSFEITDFTSTYNYQQRLQQEVKERTDKIESIQRKVIGSIASIVEARSIETGEHIMRTSEYVRDTALALRDLGLYSNLLTKDYIDLLADCAPLHDIGKIQVPDEILNKPGKLGAEEFEQMKIHAEVGARIIESTMRGVESDEYVQLAHEVALFHHERWDGTGYPKGIRGEEIPLSARIMAVADTYDALRSERCYKPPFTKEQAIEIIKKESGNHFDPTVAKAFLLTLNK